MTGSSVQKARIRNKPIIYGSYHSNYFMIICSVINTFVIFLTKLLIFLIDYAKYIT